jgi:replicative DNA helicase
MSYFESGLREIEENRERKLTGGFNSIPFGYKRLQQHIPGIQKSNYTIVTANSGIGKSRFVKNMYVFKPHDFVMKNPLTGLKLTTLYFCLEEPARAFAQSVMSYKLWTDFKQRTPIKELRSQLNPEDPTAMIDQLTLDRLALMQPYFQSFAEQVHVIEDVRRPYAIYKYVQDFMHEIGDFHLKPVKYFDPVTKTVSTKMGRGDFFMKDPNHYVQVIIDHVSLLEPEKDHSLHEAIRIFSSRYMVSLRNKYGCSIVVVQQQSSDKEKQQYTLKGASIEAKLEPSLDGLGDCKLTQRDADEITGIFAPDRYEIATHRGYDISTLGDNYRSYSLLKTRDGRANLRLGFYFDGGNYHLAELPKPKEMTKAHYEKALRLAGRTV